MNPSGLNGVQKLGITVVSASLLAVPALGVVGFAASGPVGASLAGLWQSSIGTVQAGSLFACKYISEHSTFLLCGLAKSESCSNNKQADQAPETFMLTPKTS